MVLEEVLWMETASPFLRCNLLTMLSKIPREGFGFTKVLGNALARGHRVHGSQWAYHLPHLPEATAQIGGETA